MPRVIAALLLSVGLAVPAFASPASAQVAAGTAPAVGGSGNAPAPSASGIAPGSPPRARAGSDAGQQRPAPRRNPVHRPRPGPGVQGGAGVGTSR